MPEKTLIFASLKYHNWNSDAKEAQTVKRPECNPWSDTKYYGSILSTINDDSNNLVNNPTTVGQQQLTYML